MTTCYKVPSGSKRTELNVPVINRVNIVGDRDNELFIDVNGKRFYAEIDGRRIEDYIKNK